VELMVQDEEGSAQEWLLYNDETGQFWAGDEIDLQCRRSLRQKREAPDDDPDHLEVYDEREQEGWRKATPLTVAMARGEVCDAESLAAWAGIDVTAPSANLSLAADEAVRALTAILFGSLRETGPSGWRPGDANPELLDEDEAIRYLRLDTIHIRDPRDSIRRYRKLGNLRGTQVGKRVFYLRSELDAFLRKMTEINPR
jgi:hypothetical protein